MANRITKHIPNALTCCNLLAGCVAIMYCMRLFLIDRPMPILICILIGAAFDFCDGLAARALKAYSPVGKELDSLADVITFGLAPALLCMHTVSKLYPQSDVLPYLGLVIVVASALRLAKFNTDDRQSSSFLGLPVPANALFWCSLVLWLPADPSQSGILRIIIPLLIVVSAVLMLCELPLFSLKFKSFTWADNSVRYIFLAGAVILIAGFWLKGIALTVAWYILLSLITQRKA